MTERDIGRRAAVVTLGTAAVVAGLLAAVSLAPLRHAPPPKPQPVIIEAGVVTLPPPPAPAKPAPPQPVHRPPPPMLKADPDALPVHAPKPHRKPRPPKPQPPKPQPPAQPPPPPAAPAPAPPPPATAPAANGLSGGQSGARAIIHPAPVIPPELRNHALDVVAVVRFTVAADGTAQAELIQATPVAELNQVLLDTFKRWRFFPATKDGKPVASVQELRVPVRVE